MEKEKYAAVVLAAGQGKRMGSSVHKQYLLLRGKPLLYYSLKAFEESPVDEIVLVVGKGEADYCKREIVEKYGLRKVRCITEGGAERYHSVYCGLRAVGAADYVLIHDGARPFVNDEIIRRSMTAARKHRACVIGMPVKDTIKLADAEEFAKETPNRELVWMIQTPQAFSYPLIYTAYHALLKIEEEKNTGSCIEKEDFGKNAGIEGYLAGEPVNWQTGILDAEKIEKLKKRWEDIRITDDAMVTELLTDVPVKLVRGSYENIKITTPEDLKTAEVFLGEN